MKVSQVQEALQSQRNVWGKLSREMVKKSWKEQLPRRAPQRILLFGVGSSLFSAQLTAFCLRREWKKKQRDEDWTQIPILACSSVALGVEVIPTKGDWAFGYSHRGRTPMTLHALELCAREGAYTFLVSAQGVKGNASSDTVISTCEMEKCEPHTLGMTSSICAVTTLLLGRRVKDRWESLSRDLDPDLSQLRTLYSEGPGILLGEWEGECIAREIRLKLIEMAQVCPIVMGTEEFFHGPQLLYHRKQIKKPLWHVVHSCDSRKSELEKIFLSCRVQVKISPKHSLSWVSSLVHLQWMVLAVAMNLGCDPDGIRGV